MGVHYEAVSRRMDLVEYIYYLQYNMKKDDITVETEGAVFMVWESSCFKVNGEESTTEEFYSMLSSQWKEVTCNGKKFECVGDKYISVDPIETTIERFDNIIQI